MGINDRDYVRRDGPSFLGSFVDRGTICKWLIGINVVVFVIQLLTGVRGGHSPFTDALELNVDRVVFHGEVWRIITHAFLHSPDDPFHILFNMAFLWWFGSDVEDMYGPREFLAFYLSAAVLAGLAFCVCHLVGFNGNLAIGASGAVLAVLVLCACHFPTRIIRLMFLIPIPLWLFVVGYVAYNAYTLLAQQETGVGVSAHLGGAAFGFLYYRFHWRISPLLEGLWPNVNYWRKRAARPRLRVYHEEPPRRSEAITAVPAAVASNVEEDRIKAEMDAVLEKISRVGRDNLTADDLDVLRCASEILRRRRT